MVWTANRERTIKRIVNLDVEAIITDNTKTALQIRNNQLERNNK